MVIIAVGIVILVHDPRSVALVVIPEVQSQQAPAGRVAAAQKTGCGQQGGRSELSSGHDYGLGRRDI